MSAIVGRTELRARKIDSGRPATSLPDQPLLVGVLLLTHLLLLIIELQQVHGHVVVILNDARRYHQIATTHGLAYRDFPVEIPPLGLIAIKLLNAPDVPGTAIRLACFSFAMQLVVTFGLWKGWGLRAAYGYLVLTLPLALFLFFRIDLLAIALAVGGITLALRGKERTGGLLLAAAVLAKGWPLLLMVVLLIKHKTIAARWFAVATILAVGVWVAVGGIEAPIQVLTFRHAQGWQIYSTPGILTILLTGANPTMDAGSSRVGAATQWELGLLALALLAYAVAIWYRLRRATNPPEWAPATAMLAALLFLAPIVSEQYVGWLMPWVAMAGAQGKAGIEWTGRAIAILTCLVLFPTLLGPPIVSESLVLFRNALLAMLAVQSLVMPVASLRHPAVDQPGGSELNCS